MSGTKIMCSIVYPAKLVEKTVGGEKKYFKVSGSDPLQLVVYSNQVQSDNAAAMILPFPLIRGKNRVKVLDFSRYGGIFDDLEILFPEQYDTTKEMSYSNSIEFRKPKIEVQQVGSYKVSIVPGLADFDRLQYEQFSLDSTVKNILERYYSKGYGFIVCRLAPNTKHARYHPIAYVHEIREDSRLFVPTRHHHRVSTGSAYSKFYDPAEPSITDLRKAELMDDDDLNGFMYNVMMNDDRWLHINSKRRDIDSLRERTELDWDHDIYICDHVRLMKNPLLQKPGVRITKAGPAVERFYDYIEVDKIPTDISIPKPKTMFRLHIDSIYKYNHDLFI